MQHKCLLYRAIDDGCVKRHIRYAGANENERREYMGRRHCDTIHMLANLNSAHEYKS